MPEPTPTNDEPVAGAPDPVRDKAIRLFRYLSALAELRAKTVRDVASYEAVFWFRELPCEKECYTPAWDGGETTDEENWLRIDKPVKPVLPRPPALSILVVLIERNSNNCARSRSSSFSFATGMRRERGRGSVTFGKKCVPGAR